MISQKHQVKDWENHFQHLKIEIQRNFAYNKDDKVIELTKLIDTDIEKSLDYYIEIMSQKGFQLSITDKIMALEMSKNKLDLHLINYVEKQGKSQEFGLNKSYQDKI